ncbi:MAG: FkbM family methyltransferase [Bacteroidia bacterium]|nr:FkbM family methyltransferase [Bacteroidia bacterium]
MTFRILSIQIIIDVVERLVFYPKLKAFYLKKIIIENKDRIKTIIDVGSNRGQSIDFYLKLNKKVKIFGFEPNITLFNKLQNKYKKNSDIVLNNLGISNTNGKLLFYENIMNETSTFEEVNYNSDYLNKKAKVLGVEAKELIAKTYEVEAITLSRFLENNTNLFIDILKLDVEGHEYSCLQGLFENQKTKYPINFIQLECHYDDMYVNNKNQTKINALLKTNGFEEVARIKHSYGDFYEIIYENKLLNEA